MTPEIAVIDYNTGNLRSVAKALELFGAKPYITSEPKKILSADAVMLPGVGSFGPAIDFLNKNGITSAVYDVVSKGKMFFGVCLGYQLLFEESFEDGKHKGLGLVKGEVVKFKEKGNYKIPHMGWNSVKTTALSRKSMFKGIRDNTFFYFVHSYYPKCVEKNAVSGKTNYIFEFPCAIIKDNIWGSQFHPEKSSENGLKIIENFIDEVKKC